MTRPSSLYRQTLGSWYGGWIDDDDDNNDVDGDDDDDDDDVDNDNDDSDNGNDDDDQRRMGVYDFGGATSNLCHDNFLVSQSIN